MKKLHNYARVVLEKLAGPAASPHGDRSPGDAWLLDQRIIRAFLKAEDHEIQHPERITAGTALKVTHMIARRGLYKNFRRFWRRTRS